MCLDDLEITLEAIDGKLVVKLFVNDETGSRMVDYDSVPLTALQPTE